MPVRRGAVRADRAAGVRVLLSLHTLPEALRQGCLGAGPGRAGLAPDHERRRYRPRMGAGGRLAEVLLLGVRQRDLVPKPDRSRPRQRSPRHIRRRPRHPAAVPPVRRLRRVRGADPGRRPAALRGAAYRLMPRARQKGRRSQKSQSSLRERVAELERERELLNAIANYAPSLICLVDGEGRVRPYASNRAFERTLGYEPHETGGDFFWEKFVADGERAAARDAILAAIRDGSNTEVEGRWVQRDGTEIEVAWTCTPLPKIASGPVYLVSGTDITE